MGNFEKLVVLTVLFLSAIVLAVSLSSDDAPKEGLTPFEDAANRARADQESAQDPGRLAMNAEGDRVQGKPPEAPQPEVRPAPEPVAEAPGVPLANAKGHPRVLRTLQGLTPAALDEYMVYKPVAADTWTSLADRFYLSDGYVPLLRAANEDVAQPRAGESILIPVYDFRAAPKDREPRLAAPARPVASEESKPQSAGTYEVVDGDSLWKIASKVYGNGTRYMDLYDANKDVLSDPDALKLGMKLKIPR
jgi:nucleoid-associated protein YgaU